jgi:predicted ATPase/DNA-binding SARP family transcriptional activator
MPANLRIKLFGNFEAWLNDEVIPAKSWPQRKTQMLLKILLSQRGQVFTQDQLIDMLFADQALDSAKRNLTKRLSELRNILEPDRGRGVASQFITRIGEGYCLDADAPCWVDVEAFETALDAARRHEDDGDWTQALAAYRQADDLYRGELLSEDRYEEWTIQLRDHWHERHLSGLEQLAECHARRGKFNLAIEQAERALQLDGNRERPYRQLMIYYWREGEQSKVHQTYQKCVEVFEELGVDASSETHTLYQNIQDGNVADLEAAYPQIESAPTPKQSTPTSTDVPSPQPSIDRPNNLPRQLTSFIGRESDLSEVKERLPQTGLLTLTGMGGTGKTRLALKAASEILDNYPDGVWFVDLAPLSDADLVLQTVAAAMSVAETSGIALEKTLIEVLQPKQVLLVFDNCEHVLSACAALIETLLQQCPDLSILATSREPLNIVGEFTWPVMPLSVPEINHADPLAQLDQSEAAQLFLDRVRAIRPQFELSQENASAVLSVCQQLDGIPLALELAAARVRALPISKLAERLEDRFRLLTAGSRTALPRQQTLKAALDWSYELLSMPEKQLLNRLSIFSGGWSLEAAEAVCGDTEDFDVFELLSALVQKSLVEMHEQATDVRYRLLETVKQYGWERLAAEREVDAHWEKHSQHYFSLAEVALPELTGADQGQWLNKLALEHGNIRAAMEWFWAMEQSEKLMNLCANLGQFWELHGHYSEGRRWLDRALTHKDTASNIVQANTLRWAGTLADDQGDYAVAREFLTDSQGIFQQLGDKTGEATVLRMLGQVLRNEGSFDRSREVFEASLEMHRELGNLNEMGVLHRNLGNVAFDQGNDPVAKVHYEDSLKLHRETGDKIGISHALNNLGIMKFQAQDMDGAKDSYEECIEIYEELGSENSVATTLNNLGIVYFRKKEFDKAREIYSRSVAINQSLGEKITLNRTLYNLGNVELFDGNFQQALDFFKQSIDICMEIKNSQFLAFNFAALSNYHHDQGREQIAIQLQGRVRALLDDSGAAISTFEQARVDESAEEMMQDLGQDAYQKEFSVGYEMSTEQAIEIAFASYK